MMRSSDKKLLLKPLVWVASAKRDFDAFPALTHREVGYALYLAQIGKKSDDSKALKGFGDAGVLEVVTAFDGDAYRTVYTVRLESAIYVLHAFQKKSKAGSATPKQDIELIRRRLRSAKEDHDATMEDKK
jgi:phage-related protein